jgi:hypothetical protein
MAASRLDPGTAKYTVVDLETVTANAVRAALQQYALDATSPTKAPGKWTALAQLVYCWLHSWCNQPGNECTGTKTGQPCTHRYKDSRNAGQYDASKVFKHVGCTRNPRCISATDAAKAVRPFSIPNMPENAYK